MLKLYNTLSRKIEPVEPIEPGIVKIYSCGPTVYRNIHIGNLRTFLMADWVRRALVSEGLEVLHVKNITDVGHMRVERLDQGEDKILAQARQERKSSADITQFYTDSFFDDEARMNILPAQVFPRATEHIAEMIEIVQELERKGLAYVVDGNVFFDIHNYPDYGQLSGNQLANLMEGVRDTLNTQRRNPEDFPLWKLAEPGREMAWDSPWGRGFPGWHIECSAMSIKYLGRHFDIHTGGVDNIFPHHECELAQSEGFTDERFVNIWVHAQHLLADGLKMAKSTGNAYTLEDIEVRGFEPMALRYLFATVHYRSRLNFTFSALRAAQKSLYRLRQAVWRLAQTVELDRLPECELVRSTEPYQQICAAIARDLNIPLALAIVWDKLRGRGTPLPTDLQLAILLDVDQVLGLQLAEALHNPVEEPSIELPAQLIALINERERLRVAKNFAQADALREQIIVSGYAVRDTRKGPIVEARPPEEEFITITRALDVVDQTAEADLYEFSVNLLARDSRADLQRCIERIARNRQGRNLEVMVIDNGSTDDTVPYLQDLVRRGLCDINGEAIPLTVLFADHNTGFAAGRNATMRASRGRVVVLLDTSIELQGDIWTPLETALSNELVGLVGPYGLETDDLKEFYESNGPRVDAVEGYLMAFRRAVLPEVGWFDEKFRFYRLLDIYESFMFKTAGYDVIVCSEVVNRIERHPHLEWYSLNEEERATKSKKNYDIFRRRWHHGQSLQAQNFVAANRWFGHDHPHHLVGDHTHAPEDMPPLGQPHTHKHQHWPDHDHEHPHYHDTVV